MDRWPSERSSSPSDGLSMSSGTSVRHLTLTTGSMSPSLSRATSSLSSPAALTMAAETDAARTAALQARALQPKPSSSLSRVTVVKHTNDGSSGHSHTTDGIRNSKHSSIYDDDDNDDNMPPAVRLAKISYQPLRWSDELASLLAVAIPVLLTYFLEYLPASICVLFVGHMNVKEYLDAVSLATMYQNITSLAVGFGLASALETLCSHAAGHGEKMMIGIYLQRGILVVSIAFLPMAALSWYAADILIALGQPSHIAILAGQFSRWMLPGVPFLLLFDLIRKALQAQNQVIPTMLIAAMANVVNVALCYYWIEVAQVGFIGAAWAKSVSSVVFPLVLIIYLWWSEIGRTFWCGWSWHCLLGWTEFLSLAIPSMAMTVLEWGAFEVLALMAGLLPNADVSLAAHMILLNMTSLTYMFYLSTGVAVTVRIGNLLGASHAKQAKLAARVAVVCSLICAVACVALYICARNYLPHLYTADPDITALVTRMCGLLAFYQVFDSLNAYAQGVFRGSGRQSEGAIINFMSYYLIGLPLAAYFGFRRKWGLWGLWCGAIVAVVTASITSIWRVYNFNWQREVENALERLRVNASIMHGHHNHGGNGNGNGMDDNEFLRPTTYSTFIEDTPTSSLPTSGANGIQGSYRDPYDYRY